ncbi:AAA family ATPase [Paenibacillus sp. BR2-3]|uniref:AAA family ATPase n=1 Tax=Paenibacillus sp. BR2-3 TaxID=3048494 RepID=UPI003977AC15
MKIQHLEISGFGRLRNVEVELGDGVTVLYGRNEAGKSTLLQFMRSMLFGIPSRSNPLERYEPAQGGIHGGTLTARDGEGGSWKIHRYTGGGAGQGKSEKLTVTLSRSDGTLEELGQGELERNLLGGISRSMFRQLFAVSLDELQQLAALQSEEMSSYLFHAGMGGGGDIMRAERRLLGEAEKLYKPRGKLQDAAKILQAMEKLERQIAESRTFLPRYNEITVALKTTEGELAKLEDRGEETFVSLTRLRKVLEIRDVWLKWREARLELAELPVVEAFPEDAPARWHSLEGEIRNAEGLVARGERNLSELNSELEQNQPDELLAAQGPAIESLDRRRGSYEDRSLERQRVAGELRSVQDHLHRLLRSIHSGWSSAELAAFPCAAVDREAGRRFAAAFAGYDRRMEGLGAGRHALRSRLATAAAALQAADRALAREQAAGAEPFAALRPASAAEAAQLWGELQQAAERWREGLLRGPQRSRGGESDAMLRQRMASLYRRLLLAGAALTALLPAALWLTGAPPVSAWIALGLLAAADLALWAGVLAQRRARVSPPEPGGDDAAAAEMLRLRGLLLSGAAPESRAASPDASGLEAGMKELRRLMDSWTAWQQKIERLTLERDAGVSELESLTGQERVLTEELEQAENAFQETVDRYDEWLRERKLPEGLSPEGLPDIFSTVEQGNELLRQEKKLAQRMQELEQECAAFEAECQTLAAECGADLKPLSRLSWLEARKRAWDELKAGLQRRESLLSSVLKMEAELVESRRELSGLKFRRDSLLAEGGAVNGEDFLRRAAVVQQREELSRSIRQWELIMFGGFEAKGTAQVLDLLDHNDLSVLNEQRIALEAAVSEVEEGRNRLLQQRGKLLQEQENLEERCLEDSPMQQLEEQRAALRELAGQYAVAALAAELIGRTRRIYEQEKQPQVLMLASAYFEHLTGGEYRRVVMTLGNKELKAEHRDAGLLHSGALSRGTAEQLYLALRLALAETMTRQAPLPLLFDDLFVNFDEHRLHAALTLLGDLSTSRQVVMMTCHRHVAEAAAALIPGATIISV